MWAWAVDDGGVSWVWCGAGPRLSHQLPLWRVPSPSNGARAQMSLWWWGPEISEASAETLNSKHFRCGCPHGSYKNASVEPRRAFATYYMHDGSWICRCDLQSHLSSNEVVDQLVAKL